METSASGPRSHRRLIIGTWAVLLVVISGGSLHMRLSQNSSDLYMVPDGLRNLEKLIDSNWGREFRQTGMFYVEGSTVEGALRKNDQLAAFLSKQETGIRFLSIHSVLPSVEIQKQRWEQWKAMFDADTMRTLRERLAAVSWPQDSLQNLKDSLETFDPILPESYRDTFVEPILKNFLTTDAEQVRVYALSETVPDKTREFIEVETAAKELSASKISRRLNVITIGQFRNLVVTTLLAVLVFGFILLRDWRVYLCSMLPMLTGLGCMIGLLGWTQTPVTFFHAAAVLLVIGLGVDYGILVSKMANSDSESVTGKAVWISSLTTLAGFIALAFSAHPFLFTLGTNVSIGVTAAMLTALHVSPRILDTLTHRNS